MLLTSSWHFALASARFKLARRDRSDVGVGLHPNAITGGPGQRSKTRHPPADGREVASWHCPHRRVRGKNQCKCGRIGIRSGLLDVTPAAAGKLQGAQPGSGAYTALVHGWNGATRQRGKPVAVAGHQMTRTHFNAPVPSWGQSQFQPAAAPSSQPRPP